ncbi:MAG: DNA repair protein RecO [Gammaproteobacteria bacterium]
MALESAYVLHRRAYRDSSLIVDFLARHQGRIAVVARGARRPRSRYQGSLEPFQPLLVSWGGRGELGTLHIAERAAGGGGLPGRLLPYGFYLNELLLRLLHRDDPCPEIFQAYRTILRELEEAGEPDSALLQSLLRVFEKRLLEALGYGLNLQYDGRSGEHIRPEGKYRYYPQQGAVAMTVTNAWEGEGSSVEVHGSSLLALAEEKLEDPRSLRESRRLMRFVLCGLLGARPLHSRSLLTSYGHLSDTRQLTGEGK